METLHAASAVATAVCGVAIGVLGLIAAVTGRQLRLTLDRLVLVGLVAAGVAIVTGPVLWWLGRQPRDPLHQLYAVAAAVVLPLARFVPLARDWRRRAAGLAAGGLLVVGLVVRLAQTG
jgi:hypothetical protein